MPVPFITDEILAKCNTAANLDVRHFVLYGSHGYVHLASVVDCASIIHMKKMSFLFIEMKIKKG